eukprot:746240-Hanusia_phi.AAC.5
MFDLPDQTSNKRFIELERIKSCCYIPQAFIAPLQLIIGGIHSQLKQLETCYLRSDFAGANQASCHLHGYLCQGKGFIDQLNDQILQTFNSSMAPLVFAAQQHNYVAYQVCQCSSAFLLTQVKQEAAGLQFPASSFPPSCQPPPLPPSFQPPHPLRHQPHMSQGACYMLPGQQPPHMPMQRLQQAEPSMAYSDMRPFPLPDLVESSYAGVEGQQEEEEIALMAEPDLKLRSAAAPSDSRRNRKRRCHGRARAAGNNRSAGSQQRNAGGARPPAT